MTISCPSTSTFLDQCNKGIIEEWKKNAQIKHEQRIQGQKTFAQEREKTFLVELALASQEFIRQLSERILHELQDCASRGYFQKKFRFSDFRDKFGPVRVSTLVKGFHVRGDWDPSIFQKINMSMTPFEQVVQLLQKRGVVIKDVSDISKSTGFWILVTFDHDSP